MQRAPLPVRLSRVQFRCWHRGTQESDFLLGSFADSCLAYLDTFQLDRFEMLLDCPDPDLFDWIFGISEPPIEYDHDVFRMLQAFWAERQGSRLPLVKASAIAHAASDRNLTLKKAAIVSRTVVAAWFDDIADPGELVGRGARGS